MYSFHAHTAISKYFTFVLHFSNFHASAELGCEKNFFIEEVLMSQGTAKVTAKAGLNVRTGAGQEYTKIGSLANGTNVRFTGEQNGWLQINYNNRTGYICKTYTQITQASSVGTSPSGGKTMYTTANSLNVRKGPGKGYAAIGSLSYGTAVSLLCTESNGWHKISYKGGTAYISGSYVQTNKPAGATANAPAKAPANSTSDNSGAKTTKVVVSSSLNIRESANKNSKVIGSLSNGAKVTYTGETNGWLRITSPKTGYISKEYTEVGGAKNNSGGKNTGHIDTSTIGAGGLHAMTTKQVAAADTGRKQKTIIDLWTKKAFNVSWDSSSGYHSDCTPWSVADTTVFKSIRNPSVSADNKSYWSKISSWSWDARPAAVQLKDGRWVACGYHQRPHAAIMGGNPGHPFTNQSNTRPAGGWALGGHFCLYYGDSPGGTPKCNDAAKIARNMSL